MTKPRILLVEDDSVSIIIICKFLAKIGYEQPLVATNGSQAVALARQYKPDLILMDIFLDGSMTGIDAAEQINKTFQPPIIFLTAHHDNEILSRAKLLEPFGFLSKPCNLRELQSTIEVALYKSAADSLRLKAEQELRNSELKFRTLFSTIQDAIFLTDAADGMIAECNDKVFDYLRDELIGSTTEELGLWADLRDCHKLVELVRAQGSINDFVATFRRKDGSHFPGSISTNAFPVNGKNYLLSVVRDISERKNAEDALKAAHDKLEQRVAERTAELARANEEMKKVSFELVWAEEQERERIAAELHDQVGHALLLAKMKIDALVDSIPVGMHHQDAGAACSLLQDSIRNLRTLTFRMRPPILDTTGIATALEWLSSSISTDYALRIDFNCETEIAPLPKEVSYALYQAVRELLLNVVKHAGTDSAQLSVTSAANFLSIQVKDNGVGFNATDLQTKQASSKSYGLHLLSQRIEKIGGLLEIDSSSGQGTAVTLHFPFVVNG